MNTVRTDFGDLSKGMSRLEKAKEFLGLLDKIKMSCGFSFGGGDYDDDDFEIFVSIFQSPDTIEKPINSTFLPNRIYVFFDIKTYTCGPKYQRMHHFREFSFNYNTLSNLTTRRLEIRLEEKILKEVINLFYEDIHTHFHRNFRSDYLAESHGNKVFARLLQCLINLNAINSWSCFDTLILFALFYFENMEERRRAIEEFGGEEKVLSLIKNSKYTKCYKLISENEHGKLFSFYWNFSPKLQADYNNNSIRFFLLLQDSSTPRKYFLEVSRHALVYDYSDGNKRESVCISTVEKARASTFGIDPKIWNESTKIET